jgi:hypothetical protein
MNLQQLCSILHVFHGNPELYKGEIFILFI